MPDASIIEANRSLLEYGALGIFLFFTLCALVFSVKQWLEKTRELSAEKDKRIDDVRTYAAESATHRRAMEANTTAIQTVLEFVKRST